MKGKIAIEPALTNIRDYLTAEGYEVENISIGEQYGKTMDAYKAVVISGMNDNFLGIENTETDTVVINADGLTPSDIAQRINRIH